MRFPQLAAALCLIATPANAASGDIPMVAIGLPFAPETPRPVASTHTLYQRIDIGEIVDLPATVGSSKLNFIRAAKRSSINSALRETFQHMNMLAPQTSAARALLTVSWKGSHTPFKIGGRNVATATLRYRLVRISNGELLFDREITTSAEGGGIDASMRDNGIVRAAIATNFASAANCLDRAALGTAPADCTLTPKFSVSIVRGRR